MHDVGQNVGCTQGEHHRRLAVHLDFKEARLRGSNHPEAGLVEFGSELDGPVHLVEEQRRVSKGAKQDGGQSHHQHHDQQDRP